MTDQDSTFDGQDRTPSSNMTLDTTWNHPINEQYVSTPSHSNLSRADLHHWLEQISLITSEEHVKSIGNATPFDAIAISEDTNTIGTYTNAVWEDEIFPHLGLTYNSSTYNHDYVNEAQFLLKDAHQSHAVNELGMDPNQPLWMLIASTIPTRLRAELDLVRFPDVSSFENLIKEHELRYDGIRTVEKLPSLHFDIRCHDWVPIDDRDVRLSTGCHPTTGNHLHPNADDRKGYAGHTYLAGVLHEIEPLCRDIFHRAHVKTEEVHPSPRENEPIADILLRHAHVCFLPPEPHAQIR